MATCVCAGALLQCSFGAAPSPLAVLPTNRVLEGAPGANIMDNKPLTNIASFGMCRTPSNPAVALATSLAASPVPVPAPCVPATTPTVPWIPTQPKVLLAGYPILTSASKLTCTYGGVISVTQPGQVKVQA